MERDITEEKVLGEYESTTKKKTKKQNQESEKLTDAMARKVAKAAVEQEDEEQRESATVVSAATLSSALEEEEEEEVEEVEMDEKAYAALMGEMHISAEDEEAMALFMPDHVQAQVKLSDIIMQKIAEKEMGGNMEGMEDEMPELDPRVVEVYTHVGKVLTRFKSGKIPKAFKMIASLANWEEMLYITDPDEWSANAMYEATRIFTSRPPKVLQRFLNLVLLPRVRDDIRTNRKLNYHLFRSLKKCLFKPAAFYKGILLPLAESGTCTLQEAWIICSVMSKVSIRLMDSAAALLKLAEMEYSGSTSLFMRTLLDKKYALPYIVLDAVSAHFLRFARDERQMPVVWHQCLQTFVQRYKEDLTIEEKEEMKVLMKQHIHPQITPDIRRELFASRSRGEKAAPTDMEVEV